MARQRGSHRHSRRRHAEQHQSAGAARPVWPQRPETVLRPRTITTRAGRARSPMTSMIAHSAACSDGALISLCRRRGSGAVSAYSRCDAGKIWRHRGDVPSCNVSRHAECAERAVRQRALEAFTTACGIWPGVRLLRARSGSARCPGKPQIRVANHGQVGVLRITSAGGALRCPRPDGRSSSCSTMTARRSRTEHVAPGGVDPATRSAPLVASTSLARPRVASLLL